MGSLPRGGPARRHRALPHPAVQLALGAVAAGRDGATRVREVWDAITRAAVPPNAVTMALLARGLCRSARDVVPTLAVLREGISQAPVDAYVLNVLLNVLLRSDAANENKEVTRDAALAVWTAGKDLHDERTLTSTIKVLSDAGDAEAARRTFDDATRRGTPIDADCLRGDASHRECSYRRFERGGTALVEGGGGVVSPGDGETWGGARHGVCQRGAHGVQPRRKLPRHALAMWPDARGSRRAVAG